MVSARSIAALVISTGLFLASASFPDIGDWIGKKWSEIDLSKVLPSVIVSMFIPPPTWPDIATFETDFVDRDDGAYGPRAKVTLFSEKITDKDDPSGLLRSIIGFYRREDALRELNGIFKHAYLNRPGDDKDLGRFFVDVTKVFDASTGSHGWPAIQGLTPCAVPCSPASRVITRKFDTYRISQFVLYIPNWIFLVLGEAPKADDLRPMTTFVFMQWVNEEQVFVMIEVPSLDISEATVHDNQTALGLSIKAVCSFRDDGCYKRPFVIPGVPPKTPYERGEIPMPMPLPK